MPRLSSSSYDWAIKHLETLGDSDIFPRAFEISAMRNSWPELLAQLIRLDVSNYKWKQGQRLVIPKRTLAFRVATQLDPLDTLILSALIYEIGSLLEGKRIPISSNKVFSYRFDPQQDGRMYGSSLGWTEFWEESRKRAASKLGSWVVIVDIADFYNQIYHHVIERQLDTAGVTEPVCTIVTKFLQAQTGKESRGIPVGPHFAHILAELALDALDRSLTSHGIDFCRYVDDIHIFTSGKDAAIGALYDVASILDSQERLILQNEKTELLSAKDFILKADTMLLDRPANENEKKILDLISDQTSGDPYRSVLYGSLKSVDMQYLDEETLEELISLYLQSRPIDYVRLGWLEILSIVVDEDFYQAATSWDLTPSMN